MVITHYSLLMSFPLPVPLAVCVLAGLGLAFHLVTPKNFVIRMKTYLHSQFFREDINVTAIHATLHKSLLLQ
ncbi:hypothetical protein H6G36_28975 [Anabaena minutissima FACHB-250]|nr:hypothetical protein [Anabaena minutissima FACHB-250]